MQSLLAQGADAVWLWIPPAYDRFPDWDGVLPDIPAGVDLKRASADFGPASKFIPALCDLRPSDGLMMCDDDVIYGPGWLDAFRKMEAGGALAGSTFDVSRLGLLPRAVPGRWRIAQGFAGIMLCPEMLPAGVADIPPEHRAVDDIWLSGHLAAKGVAIHDVPGARSRLTHIGSDIVPLQDATLSGVTRAQANVACAQALRDQLGIWDVRRDADAGVTDQ